MLMRFFTRKDPRKNFLNKAIIGLGIGLVRSKDLVLNPDYGPQGAMDILGVWIGQEIVKEMFNQKMVTPGISEKNLIEKLLEELRIAEGLEMEYVDEEIEVTIQDCLVCPKRVGGYDLGGDTSCPVGGILIGALSYFRGESPSFPNVQLRPGEFCSLKLKLKK